MTWVSLEYLPAVLPTTVRRKGPACLISKTLVLRMRTTGKVLNGRVSFVPQILLHANFRHDESVQGHVLQHRKEAFQVCRRRLLIPCHERDQRSLAQIAHGQSPPQPPNPRPTAPESPVRHSEAPHRCKTEPPRRVRPATH